MFGILDGQPEGDELADGDGCGDEQCRQALENLAANESENTGDEEDGRGNQRGKLCKAEAEVSERTAATPRAWPETDAEVRRTATGTIGQGVVIISATSATGDHEC